MATLIGGSLRDRVLAIVNFIAQYVFEKNDFLNDDGIIQELISVGFNLDEINAAFSWIENLSTESLDTEGAKEVPANHTFRIFSSEEKSALSLESQGLLSRLWVLGLVNADEMDEIISNALSMNDGDVTLQDVKAMVAITLFSRTLKHYDREIECLLKEEWSLLYH
ncbi:MAG: DUF494 domain-containing protein [Desulfuromonadaceae bacterium]|nr:DUF494 domain-containing protein [Desulfuromonadaceae bacterium]